MERYRNQSKSYSFTQMKLKLKLKSILINPLPNFKDTMFQGFVLGIGSTLERRIFTPKIAPELLTNTYNTDNNSISVHNIKPLEPEEIFTKYKEYLVIK
jgi:hypothetical protein